MPDCIFCKIVSKGIPAEILFENESLIAIRDINPQAPFHILILPKKHIASLYEVDSVDIVGEICLVARDLAKKLFDSDMSNGFRLVCNTGSDGGQTVDHLHFHLLGGRALGWPPG